MKRSIRDNEKVIEGVRTGGSASKTGAMTGRYLRRLAGSVKSGETNPEVLRQKKAQAKRLSKRVGGRYGGDEGYEDLAKEGQKKFDDAQKGGEGKGTMWYHDEDARAPDNAPNPTDVKRRAKGRKPYRQRSSNEILRKGRIQLAERVLKELLEGRRTGGDFGATERMTARFINKMEKDGASPEQVDKAEIQADRIRNKMTARNKRSSKAQALKGPLKVKAAGLPKQNAGSQHLLTRLKGNTTP